MQSPSETAPPACASQTEMISVARAHLALLLAAGWLVHDLYFASSDEDADSELAEFSNSNGFLDLIAERGLAASVDASPAETDLTGVETIVSLSDEFEAALESVEDLVWPGPRGEVVETPAEAIAPA